MQTCRSSISVLLSPFSHVCTVKQKKIRESTARTFKSHWLFPCKGTDWIWRAQPHFSLWLKEEREPWETEGGLLYGRHNCKSRAGQKGVKPSSAFVLWFLLDSSHRWIGLKPPALPEKPPSTLDKGAAEAEVLRDVKEVFAFHIKLIKSLSI